MVTSCFAGEWRGSGSLDAGEKAEWLDEWGNAILFLRGSRLESLNRHLKGEVSTKKCKIGDTDSAGLTG